MKFCNEGLCALYAVLCIANLFLTGPGDRGDASESFAFHTLFPEMLQPHARKAGAFVHRHCHPFIIRLLAVNRHTDSPNASPNGAQGRSTGGSSGRGSQQAAADPEEVRHKAAAAAIQRAATSTATEEDQEV